MNPWFKLLVWIGLGWWVGRNVKSIWVFGFLAVFGTLQAFLGTAQFTVQGDLGLQLLGESVLSPLNRDVARTFIEGGRLVRAYGTFPHPNILAVFLTLTILSLYYFWIANKNRTIVLYLLTTFLFINWLGLLLTFSRAGWLIALVVTWLFLLLSYLYDRKNRIVIVRLNVLIFLVLTFLILIFHWAIFPRLEFNDSFSAKNRLSDFQYAWQKIKERPLFGHGLTLAMGERPIHNLYLTIWKEVGLLGLSMFLLTVIWIFFKNLRLEIISFNPERRVLLLMFIVLLVSGLFDHFLWTLRPGLAMLFLVVGPLFSGSVHSLKDKAQASEA